MTVTHGPHLRVCWASWLTGLAPLGIPVLKQARVGSDASPTLPTENHALSSQDARTARRPVNETLNITPTDSCWPLGDY